MSEPRETEQSFVATSKVRAVVRAAIREFANTVLAPAIAKAVCELIRESETRIEVRITGLETKIAALEARSVSFRGVWREGDYKQGDLAAIPALGVYRATRDTQARPGSGDSWVLVLKAGRDGKDGAPGRDAAVPPPAPSEPRGPRQTTSHRT